MLINQCCYKLYIFVENLNKLMKWTIEKEIELHGRKVKAVVPNPKVPRELAFKRFKELVEEVAKRKAS